jgi:hypothetical protein
MAMLIALLTRRFESASKFQAEQARKELRKLKKIHRAAGLTSAPRCSNPRCGWQAVYARRYGIPNFPCVHTVGTGIRVIFPFPAPIDRLFNIEPQVFEGPLPDGIDEFVQEESMMPRKVIFEHLAHNDDPDTTFLDDLCQEMRSLMTPPPSYPSLSIQLTILYHQARLAGEPVYSAGRRATFQCEQNEKAEMDYSPCTVSSLALLIYPRMTTVEPPDEKMDLTRIENE